MVKVSGNQPEATSVSGPATLHATATGGGSKNPQIETVITGPDSAGPGGTSTYTHVQTSASAEWLVTHGLGTKVFPTLVLSSDPAEPVWTDVVFIDENSLLVQWPEPVSGWAYI
jgi:hypothetical protein